MKGTLFLALAALPAFSGCQGDSFAVVSVLMASGTLDGVAQFRVHTGNQGGDAGKASSCAIPTRQPRPAERTRPAGFCAARPACGGHVLRRRDRQGRRMPAPATTIAGPDRSASPSPPPAARS
jgi:hypothetical protein